jgi:uncharacterized membrane protein YccC
LHTPQKADVLATLRSAASGLSKVKAAGLSDPGLCYALAAGAMTSLAILIERLLALPNGYWAPMTALIILKPEVRATFVRTTQRTAGTLVGGAAAVLIAAFMHPTETTLALLVVPLAWCAYAAQRVNYAIFSLCITAAVVFLLSMTGLPEPEVALRRILATVIGAALAVGASALVGRQP